MHDLPAPARTAPLRRPELVTLATSEPSLFELFAFMEEAELRFERLRMRIVDRRVTASGEHHETHDIWIRHPGWAKVVSTRGVPTDRDFDVWVSDGETVRTYDARAELATTRRRLAPPVGATDPELPAFARVYLPVTPLPAETLAETFVHPRGLCRNVLASGITRIVGTAGLAGGREAIVLRSDHPRTSHVLTDRPDHWLEVGVDRQTGLVLLLAEHIGGRITRHAEAAWVAIDEPIGDEAFTLHVADDTRVLY
ncbi:MAG TPA: hypothetical protein VK992_04240 [Candidatus Caenarcaniphilales bacterium]|nr:hypothetical protein [Candidatus Caenarcaniphilales bacterium]